MGLRMESFKLWLRTVIDDGGTLRRSGAGFTSVAVPGTAEANTFTAAQTIAPTAATSGVRTALTVTQPADTGRTATTEQSSLYINLGATVTWATGAVSAQRFVRISRPTIAAAGASTFTSVATVYIEHSPMAGSNATLTNTYALWVDDGRVRLDGTLALLVAPSLYADTQTGASPTVSRPAGVVRVPSGSTSVTVTNTLVTATSHVYAQIRNTPSNAVSVLRVVPGSGTFDIVLSGDPGAANADVSFFIVEPNAGT